MKLVEGKESTGEEAMGAEKKFSPSHTLYFWLVCQQGGRQVPDVRAVSYQATFKLG